MPFWDAVLDKVPQELAEISVHAGHWSKVNIHWLSSARAPQLVQFLKTVHDLFPRMLRHLPYVSPIFDVLVKLANTDETHPQLGIIEWLHNAKLIPQVLELLDPVSSPMEAHAPASEFLRSLIAATSAAVAAKQQQQQQEAAKMGEINSESLGLTMSSAAWSNWPNNTLVRELASQRTMDTLLGYMLDVQPSDTTDTNGHDSSADTPTSSTFPKSQSSPTRRASREAITSSLLNSLTVIIDIIRKNNSDFTELQIFHFLERTSGGSETGERIGLEGEGEEGFVLQDQGPSLVDLEPLLRSITGRLGDLNRLLTHPRSDVSLSYQMCGRTRLTSLIFVLLDYATSYELARHKSARTTDFRTFPNMRTLRRTYSLLEYGNLEPRSSQPCIAGQAYSTRIRCSIRAHTWNAARSVRQAESRSECIASGVAFHAFNGRQQPSYT